jgi:hypothetical protein
MKKCCDGVYQFVHKSESPINLPKGYMGVEVCKNCGKVVKKVKTIYFNDGHAGDFFHTAESPRIRSKRFCDII